MNVTSLTYEELIAGIDQRENKIKDDAAKYEFYAEEVKSRKEHSRISR